MFTVTQIKEAHSKVKSGSDFPAFIREIHLLGVTGYTTFVGDGHTIYHGSNDYSTTSPARYEPLPVAKTSAVEQFKEALKEHQQGKSDYLTFIGQCATHGISKWEVNMEKLTCTYFDLSGNRVLTETIPGQ